MRKLGLIALATLVIVNADGRAFTQAPQRNGTNPPAVFADPGRRAKLAAAFPEIDRMIGRLHDAHARAGRRVGHRH